MERRRREWERVWGRLLNKMRRVTLAWQSKMRMEWERERARVRRKS